MCTIFPHPWTNFPPAWFRFLSLCVIVLSMVVFDASSTHHQTEPNKKKHAKFVFSSASLYIYILFLNSAGDTNQMGSMFPGGRIPKIEPTDTQRNLWMAPTRPPNLAHRKLILFLYYFVVVLCFSHILFRFLVLFNYLFIVILSSFVLWVLFNVQCARLTYVWHSYSKKKYLTNHHHSSSIDLQITTLNNCISNFLVICFIICLIWNVLHRQIPFIHSFCCLFASYSC